MTLKLYFEGVTIGFIVNPATLVFTFDMCTGISVSITFNHFNRTLGYNIIIICVLIISPIPFTILKNVANDNIYVYGFVSPVLDGLSVNTLGV